MQGGAEGAGVDGLAEADTGWKWVPGGGCPYSVSAVVAVAAGTGTMGAS